MWDSDVPGALPVDHRLQFLAELHEAVLRRGRPHDTIPVRVIAADVGLCQFAELGNRYRRLLRGLARLDVLAEQCNELTALDHPGDVGSKHRRRALQVEARIVRGCSKCHVIRGHHNRLLHAEPFRKIRGLHRGGDVLPDLVEIATGGGTVREVDGIGRASFGGHQVTLLVGCHMHTRNRMADVNVRDGRCTADASTRSH